jgi:TRAP-type C4-dicarboxylate transport system permease small subunit
MAATPDTAADVADGHKLVGDDGEFHAHDEAVRLGGTPVEGWAALALFWALGLTVFYQFFTRYALNDSAAWTEEIARYLLIGVVFIGAAVGVKRNNHIHVDFLYRYLPRRAGRVLSTAVDLLRIAFFAATVLLTAQMMQRMGNYKMTIIDAPMNIVYGVCLLGFAAMLVRAVVLAVQHWRRGWSLLERPGLDDARP